MKPTLVPLAGAVCDECGYPADHMLMFPRGRIVRHHGRQPDCRIGVIPPPQPVPVPVAQPTRPEPSQGLAETA